MRPLLVSVLLHAVGIAVLLMIGFPEPSRARFERLTAIVSPYQPPATRTPPALHRNIHRIDRVFHVPDRLPQPALPRLILAIPDPPIILSADVRLPEPAPPFIELPPPPVRRVVAATGAFDGAIPANHAIPTPHSAISTGTFGDASAASPAYRARRNMEAVVSSAAEILSKPRPAYTEEARRLQIQGEVLLEVLFAASGEARVLRSIRGLGHGLDENAISAAREIRFRPAKRGDTDVDSTAVVHIVFQLAY
jgi:TonB family protein